MVGLNIALVHRDSMVPFSFPGLDNNTYTDFQKTLPRVVLATSGCEPRVVANCNQWLRGPLTAVFFQETQYRYSRLSMHLCSLHLTYQHLNLIFRISIHVLGSILKHITTYTYYIQFTSRQVNMITVSNRQHKMTNCLS